MGQNSKAYFIVAAIIVLFALLGSQLQASAEFEDNCLGFLVGDPEETNTIKIIGAGWARPHPGPFSWGYIEPTQGEYDFSASDGLVKISQANNIAILATIWPFANWDQKDDPSCKVGTQDIFYPRAYAMGIPEYRCKPKDMTAYRNFLSHLIERYDGDGQDDMPGLVMPIKYWEILNEPDMKSSELAFFLGDAKDYVEILKQSYEAIKQICPDCSIVQGGAAGVQNEFLSFWEDVFKLGAGNYFDIANIHSIGTQDVSDFNVKKFKSLLNKYGIQKPVWVTEVEFRSKTADVKTSMRKALEAGASKVFFVSFNVGGHARVAPGEYSAEYKEARDLCPAP